MSMFVEKQKNLYKSLSHVFCPAIQETVYFNAEGLRHMIYKRNRPRNPKDRDYRLGLIKYLVHAISQATHATHETHSSPSCDLWVLEWVEVKNNFWGSKIKIKVIIRRMGNGRAHYLSVMMKKKNGMKSKKPNNS